MSFNYIYLIVALGFAFVHLGVYVYLNLKDKQRLKREKFEQETHRNYPGLFDKDNWKPAQHRDSLIFIPTNQPYSIFYGSFTGDGRDCKHIITLDCIERILNSAERDVFYDFITNMIDENRTKVIEVEMTKYK